MATVSMTSPATPSPPGLLQHLVLVLLQVGLLSGLYAFWLVVSRHARLPLPAGLLAMLTVLGLLLTRALPFSFVQRGATFLLRYIALLFVPLCIGAVRQLPLLRSHAAGYLLLLVAGALAGQASAGLLAQALCRKPCATPAPEGFES